MSSELDRPQRKRPFGFLVAGTLIGAALGYVSSDGEASLVQTLIGCGLGLASGLVAELAYLGKAAAFDVVIILVITLIVLFISQSEMATLRDRSGLVVH